MIISSPAFENGSAIPAKYTCDGDNIHPPLNFTDVPQNALTLVLIAEDVDAPGRVFTHWVVYDIPPNTLQIEEGSMPEEAIEGKNDFGKARYDGPCPPTGIHRYFFRLFALNKELDLLPGSEKEAVLEAMNGYVISQAEVMATYTS